MADLIRQKVHLLVIDLFPPGPRDPGGIHKVIWDQFQEEDFELQPDKPLVLAAYDAGPEQVAYVDSVAVGDTLPEMPLFLEPGVYVPAPLAATYQTTGTTFPAALLNKQHPSFPLPGSPLQWEAKGTNMGTAGGATGSAPCCRRYVDAGGIGMRWGADREMKYASRSEGSLRDSMLDLKNSSE